MLDCDAWGEYVVDQPAPEDPNGPAPESEIEQCLQCHEPLDGGCEDCGCCAACCECWIEPEEVQE